MTKEETGQVLFILKAGLPNAYLKITEADANAMVALWYEMFQQYDGELVMAAAKTYIFNDTTGKFPGPGALRKEMDAIWKVIQQCAYGRTLMEYSAAAADR